MEQLTDILLDKGLVFALMGLVIYFVGMEYKKEKKENMRLNEYILMREREISEDRMVEQKELIEVMNDVATELSRHNKITEYEQHNCKKT